MARDWDNRAPYHLSSIHARRRCMNTNPAIGISSSTAVPGSGVLRSRNSQSTFTRRWVFSSICTYWYA